MPATVGVTLLNGAGPSATNDISLLVFKWADDNTDDANAPIVRGGSTVYSWAKSIKLRFATAPTGAITNLRFFSADVNFGTSWTGVSMLATQQAGYTQGASGDQTGARSSMANYVAATPLTINSGEVINSGGTVPGYGTQNYTTLQTSIANDVPAGASATQTQTYRYAET